MRSKWFYLVLYAIATILLWLSGGWKLTVAVYLFGWAMNEERRQRG